jgi:hypothetical protein
MYLQEVQVEEASQQGLPENGQSESPVHDFGPHDGAVHKGFSTKAEQSEFEAQAGDSELHALHVPVEAPAGLTQHFLGSLAQS